MNFNKSQTMKHTLTVACILLKSVWQAVSLRSALAALLLAPLAGLDAVSADDVTARLAQGHLSAAYCSASPEQRPKQIVAIYREIIPVAAPHGSYTTVAFAGGYVGLAGNKTAEGGDTINFSIWGQDAAEVEPADKKFGAVKTRQFTHEGTGWAGRLAYPWKTATRYQVFVHVKHESDQTIYTAWFGEAAKNEWLLAGRIRRAGTHDLGKAGGFLEHAGKKDAQIPRCTGYGTSWVHDGQRWLPCTKAEVSVKDPGNARFHQKDGVIYIEIGMGLKSTNGSKFTYSMKPSSAAAPPLPESVSGLPGIVR